ncbi:MAG: hypothetical protein V1874_10915 [Spirochaetota bacterium]
MTEYLIPGKIVCLLFVFMSAIAAHAEHKECRADKKAAFESGFQAAGVLKLYAKNSSTWKAVPDGAYGTLVFNEQTGVFTFNARKLLTNTGYALVRYAGNAPYGDLLAGGKSDAAGAIHLKGRWNNWTKKIWLVLSDDITVTADSAKLTAWRPEFYLFEAWEL